MAKKRISTEEKENTKKRVVSESLKKNISAAMKGNKNAEKWTEKLVLSILKKMLDVLSVEIEESIENKEECTKTERGFADKMTYRTGVRRVHQKIELLIHMKIWNRNWFFDMKEKFAELDGDGNENENHSPSVIGLVQAIDMMCESNSYIDAASGKGASNIIAMHLAKHYGYSTSKTESKVTVEAPQFELPDVPNAIKENFNKALRHIEDAED